MSVVLMLSGLLCFGAVRGQSLNGIGIVLMLIAAAAWQNQCTHTPRVVVGASSRMQVQRVLVGSNNDCDAIACLSIWYLLAHQLCTICTHSRNSMFVMVIFIRELTAGYDVRSQDQAVSGTRCSRL